MMLMEEYKISEEIYQASLVTSSESFSISDDIFEEADTLTVEELQQEVLASYKFSGRYWIWKMGFSVFYKNKNWQKMFLANEMQMEAPGFKYFKSYSSLVDFQKEYKCQNPGSRGIDSRPIVYNAFANSLRRGDVIIACASNSTIVAWGIVESDYFYRPTRKVGKHYRNVSWTKMDMPFIFTDKPQILYMLQKEETHLLKETLVSKTYQQLTNVYPFGFVDKGYEMVIPFDRKEKSVVPTLKNPSVKVVLPKENSLSPKIIEPLKRDALAKIIGALLRVVM
jgi:hypothetical protein